MRSLYLIVALAAAAFAMSSCGKLLDGSTSDGVSLETAEREGGTGGAGSSTGPYRIFATASQYDGNLGGVSGADAKCMSDANKPAGSSTYKALIAATTRQSPFTDWPLKASTAYVEKNGVTPIGTTTAGRVFTFNLSNAISPAGPFVWTGIDTDFSTSFGTCATRSIEVCRHSAGHDLLPSLHAPFFGQRNGFDSNGSGFIDEEESAKKARKMMAIPVGCYANPFDTEHQKTGSTISRAPGRKGQLRF